MDRYSAGLFDQHDLAQDRKLLDAIRGIAVIFVYLAHADAYNFLRFEPINSIKTVFGQLGVNLFFILSGYLVWRSAESALKSTSGLKHYAINRLSRILPLYLVCLLFCVTVFPALAVDFVPVVDTETFVRHLMFTQDLNPSVSRHLNPVLWSLTHEFIFYLLVPLMVIRRWRSEWLIVLALLLTAYAIVNPDTLFGGFFEKSLLFAFGIFLSTRRVAPGWLFCALAITLCSIDLGLTLNRLVLAITVFAVLSKLRLLENTALWWLIGILALAGVISYSIYIWHYLLLEMASPWFNQLPIFRESFLARGVVFAVLCLLVSTLSYWLIERPGITLLRGTRRKPYGPPLAGAAALPVLKQ